MRPSSPGVYPGVGRFGWRTLEHNEAIQSKAPEEVDGNFFSFQNGLLLIYLESHRYVIQTFC